MDQVVFWVLVNVHPQFCVPRLFNVYTNLMIVEVEGIVLNLLLGQQTKVSYKLGKAGID